MPHHSAYVSSPHVRYEKRHRVETEEPAYRQRRRRFVRRKRRFPRAAAAKRRGTTLFRDAPLDAPTYVSLPIEPPRITLTTNQTLSRAHPPILFESMAAQPNELVAPPVVSRSALAARASASVANAVARMPGVVVRTTRLPAVPGVKKRAPPSVLRSYPSSAPEAKRVVNDDTSANVDEECCGVCYEEPGALNPMQILVPCAHTLCVSCVVQIVHKGTLPGLSVQGNCPFCRTPLAGYSSQVRVPVE